MDENSRGAQRVKSINTNAKTEPPAVYDYIDACLFLQAHYLYRKSMEKGFSYQQWADELGVVSKSYLRFAILKKRKISSDLHERFMQSIFTTDIERDYFTHLVFYSQAETESQKKYFGRQLIKSQRERNRFFEAEFPDEVCLSPLAVMVRNVLSFDDGHLNEKDLCKIFGSDSLEMQLVLSSLRDIGWIELDSAIDVWRASQVNIKVTDLPGSPSLARYHQDSLRIAIAKSESLVSQERSFRSIGIALDEKQYKDLLEEWNQFVQRIFDKNESPVLNGKRMYQVNFNAVPWTEQYKEDRS